MEHIAITIDNYDICKTSDIEKKNDYQFLGNIDILLNYRK